MEWREGTGALERASDPPVDEVKLAPVPVGGVAEYRRRWNGSHYYCMQPKRKHEEAALWYVLFPEQLTPDG